MKTNLLDIFRMDALGNVLWVEAAADLQSAKTSVETLAATRPGEYLIFNSLTNEKNTVVQACQLDGCT